MTARERVRAAIEFRESDVCPWQIYLTAPAREKLCEHYGTQNLEPILGNHLSRVSIRLPEEEVRPGHFRDEFGVVWDRTVDKDIGVPSNRVLEEATLGGLDLPNPASERRARKVEEGLADAGEKFRMLSIGFSLFERAWTLRGMENFCIDMVTNESFVDDLLDVLCEWNIAVIGNVRMDLVDGVRFGDDWGSQNGLLMGKALWDRFIKPRVARMYAAAREAGAYVAIHSCGKVQELFDDLVEGGLDLFNPFQPEVMDVYETAKRYKGRLAFLGGLSIQRTLPFGTPAEVRAEVRRLIEEVGAGGGYVLSPSHDVPGDVPVENLVALIDEVNAQ